MGDVTAAEVRAEFQTRQTGGKFRSVEAPKYASAGRFTTPETIAQERANINHVLQGKNTVSSITTAAMAEEQANARGFLNDSQRRVVEDILTTRDRVHGLQGLAGTGKTTALETIREGAEKSGYKVEGFAPTSKASGQLRDAESRPTRCKVSFSVKRQRTRKRGIFTCWTSRVWPVRNRCGSSSTR